MNERIIYKAGETQLDLSGPITLDEARRRVEAENARVLREAIEALSAHVIAIQEREFSKIRVRLGIAEPDDFVN